MREILEHYVELRDRMERLHAAEDRAFRRYMEGTGSAGTVRKAASRVNALSPELNSAESAVYGLMDRLEDTSGDLEGFVRRMLEPGWHVTQKTWAGHATPLEARPKRDADEVARNAIADSKIGVVVVSECRGDGCRECSVLRMGVHA